MPASDSSPGQSNLGVLITAAAKGDIGQVQQWLQQWQHSTTPLPPRGPPKHPMLPLQPALNAAAKGNQADIVDLLLANGCEIDPSAVVSASVGYAPDVFQVFQDRGWDINLCLGHIGDALTLATCADKPMLVQYHLSHGADPNRNRSGDVNTALECAAISASIPVLKLLLDAGAQMSTRSALSRAASYGRVEVVEFLLDRGASIDEIPDNEDIFENESIHGVKNALCTAAAKGKVEVVTLLLERGADRNVKDTLGRTALELAELGGHEDCVRVLKHDEA